MFNWGEGWCLLHRDLLHIPRSAQSLGVQGAAAGAGRGAYLEHR